MANFETASEALQCFRIYEKVFVLGCFDARRHTVLSQQYRALTLANAMKAAGLLEQKNGGTKTVGIVGAGVAGVTVAMQLVNHGCNVQIFDQQNRSLSIFDNATHRILHPGLFNWPDEGWDTESTEQLSQPLPRLMNWRMGSARSVAEKMRENFEDFCTKHGKKKSRGKFGSITFNSEERAVSWQLQAVQHNEAPTIIKTNANKEITFDYVIIAVGFGTETQLSGRGGYWDQASDCIANNHIRLGTPPPKVVIIGTGDGGLIDCVRYCLQIDTEEDLISKVLCPWNPKEHSKAKRTMYELYRCNPPNHNQLLKEFDERNYPELYAILRPLVRRGISVTVVGRDKPVSTENAARVNRLLFAVLENLECFTSLQGALTIGNGGWSISGTRYSSTDPDVVSGEVIVCARVGPTKAIDQFLLRVGTQGAAGFSKLSDMDFHQRYYEFDREGKVL